MLRTRSSTPRGCCKVCLWLHASLLLYANVEDVTYAAETVKVPQMAESISEGTLKTWKKKVGEYVEEDEEVASIETDKVRCFCR